MKREWKPGDVADINGCRVMRAEVRGKQVWTWIDGCRSVDANTAPGARPLVVIDPEDREQVERLLGYYVAPFDDFVTDGRLEHMQAALREFANPKPPRIDEPGIWGVVEAECPHSPKRREWVHHPDGNWWPAFDYSTVPERTPLPDAWDDLIDPVLIREGVQP